jgi:hypothetical protein
MRRFVSRILFQFVACAVLAMVGCDQDSSQVVSSSQWSEKVENGTVYDVATIDGHGVANVFLPSNASVQRTPGAQSIQLFMAKELSFYGHPPEPITLRTVRAYMGCAIKRESQALLVATYGEWSSIEGGSSLRLLAVVPDGIEVVLRDGLAGTESLANQVPGLHDGGPEGYWYATKVPAWGWTALPCKPDPKKGAK